MNIFNYVSQIVLCSYLLLCIGTAVGFMGEKEIRQRILSHNNMNEPPPNLSDRKSSMRGIKLGLYLQRLVEFSTERNTLTLDGYLFTGWYDERIIWNSTGKSSCLGINQDEMWKPAPMVLNRVKPFIALNNEPLCLLNYGMVYHTTTARIFTACTANLKYFPFDEHSCQLVLGVGTTSGDDIEAQAKVDIEVRDWRRYYKEHPEWNILSFKANREYYKPIQSLNLINIPARILTIVFKRTSSMISLVTLTPALLAVLFGLMPFWISPLTGAGFRLVIAATGLFIVSRATDAIYQFAPAHQGETPLIYKHCVACSILIFLSMLQSIITSCVVRRSSMPSQNITAIIQSSPSKMVLKVWGVKNGGNVQIGSSTGRLVDENFEEAVDENCNSISWSDVALVMDSFGFSLHLVAWIILSLAIFVTES